MGPALGERGRQMAWEVLKYTGSQSRHCLGVKLVSLVRLLFLSAGREVRGCGVFSSPITTTQYFKSVLYVANRMVASDSGGREIDPDVGWLVPKGLDKGEKSQSGVLGFFFKEEILELCCS